MAIKLRVKDLPSEATRTDLVGIFAEVGCVEKADIFMDTDGRRRHGFIEMSSEEEAWRAMDVLAGNYFKGKYLNIRFI